MPKLVATYLREFSCNADGKPSTLYKFIFCLCLPFVSSVFRKARLNALAIAECTNSTDQIARVINKLTGADVTTVSAVEFELPYWGSYSDYSLGFSYSEDGLPVMPYSGAENTATMDIKLNGASRSDVEAYLKLLVPFYVNAKLNFIE